MANLFKDLFIIAFLLYGTVIISHQVLNRIDRWMVQLFGLGLAADISATFVVCILYGPRWQWNWHSVSGLATFPIMAFHYLGCSKAEKGSANWQKRFHQLSPFAGIFWVGVTVSGIPVSLITKLLMAGVVIGTSCLIGGVWYILRTATVATKIKLLKILGLAMIVAVVTTLDMRFLTDPASKLISKANESTVGIGLLKLVLAFLLVFGPVTGAVIITVVQGFRIWEDNSAEAVDP